MAKGVRKNVMIPGLLVGALHHRMAEFGHTTVSPFVVDLVCYDLRAGAAHVITVAIGNDTQAAQDAVDAELVARYRPGQSREGLLVAVTQRLTEIRDIARRAGAPLPLRMEPERITFPAIIWPLANLRWRELGYSSLSAYLTGLIRYDLLVGGPHLFDASDKRRELRSALDRETVEAREIGKPRKLFLDYLIERVEGRELTPQELDQTKAEIARRLLRHIGRSSGPSATKRPESMRRPTKTLSSTRSRQRAE
jgi:hypothetical protein